MKIKSATMAGMALLADVSLAGTAPKLPNLPTACVAGGCGTNASQFVTYGTAGAAVSGNTLTVTQSTNKAILNWADFNIANGSSVKFVQPSATAAVLNKIWSANPSTIAGNLTANGQVYLYNQNGIVFAKGAQVDVASLVASTLSVSDTTFENGILSGSAAASTPAAVFVAPPADSAGTVAVEAGATLTAEDGGRVMLLGSAVTNAGTISTPDGQTILGAATNGVYLAASSNPDMRGLLIEVDGGHTTGTVTNTGQISADRGNVTLAGLMVNQAGTVSATTSVSANGSIYLVAGDVDPASAFYNGTPRQNGTLTAFGGLLPNYGGTVVLAPGSLTQVLADATDTGTLTGGQQSGFVSSQIDVVGRSVGVEGNAVVHAPSGNVHLYAAGNPNLLFLQPTQVTPDNGALYVDSKATIDVSGLSQVAVPVTDNLLTVTLETNDLQNDPLQRSGFLHGTTVTVNANSLPPLFDVSPYKANITAGIDQMLTKGGSIELNSTGQVIARAGSTLNVSGGSVAYQGGYGAATTNLLGADGKVYNIATAPTSVQYVGIANNYSYTDPTWGTTTKGSGQTYYSGYLQGADAGTVQVKGSQVYLRGTLSAETVEGPYQRTVGTLAAGGTLELGCSYCVSSSSGVTDYGLSGGLTFAEDLTDALNANVIIDGYAFGTTSVPAASLISPTQLTKSGFTTLDASSQGAVSLPAGNALNIAANGSVTLRSATAIDVAGSIRAPGGSVALSTANIGDSMAHNITLDAGGTLDVSGTWTNDSPSVTLEPGTAPLTYNGGKQVSLSAAGNVILANDSLIDVSGGGWLNQSDHLTTGTAGTISLAATFAAGSSVASASNPYVGTVDIAAGAQLKGASLTAGSGGALSLQAGSVTLGSTAQGTPGELLLAPAFFAQGGFAKYTITGLNDVTVGDPKDTADAAPVSISPIQQNLVFTQNSLLQPTGTPLSAFTQLETLAPNLRSPASLSLTSTLSDQSGADIGDIVIARDASIVMDPSASLTISANGYDGSIRDDGSISAPAGDITLQLVSPLLGLQTNPDPGYLTNQQILLGPDAVLAAPAYAKIDTTDQRGYRQGSVLAGGTVSLVANKGFIVTDAGSSINVNGAAGTLDVVGANGVTPTAVAGGGGTIDLSAREGMVLQGALTGTAATLNGAPVSGAAAGTLNVDLGVGFSYAALASTAEDLYPTTSRTLTLVGTAASGGAALPFSNQLQSGTALVNVSTIENGGFGTVSLQSSDTIAFTGTVNLHASASLSLDSPGYLAGANSQVTLMAPYVAIGNYAEDVSYFGGTTPSPNVGAVLSPSAGSGTLAVYASTIDVRGISGWSGFATETLTSTGDIRLVSSANALNNPPDVNAIGGAYAFEGAFDTSATLTLVAAQVYPTTSTQFAINDSPVATTPTVVTISSNAAATPATPLSAGGSLSINATEITQGGVLRAPVGELALNATSIVDGGGNIVTPGSVSLTAGSITSVSADGLTIPYGSTSNGTQWTYSPATGYTSVVTTPPTKQITLNGSAVSIDSGAKVDLSGGGDLYAYEFVAGQGGAVDVLDANNRAGQPGAANNVAGTSIYTYAIVPSLNSLYAPLDAQYSQGSLAQTGQTITLSGVPGLAAGTYALLPARYALLPGAYAVEVLQSGSAIAAGSSVEQANGSYVVAARLGNASAGVLDSLASTVLVASDATVRTQSSYTDSYANAFFSNAAATAAAAAPQLPADAGQLVLAASNTLALNGTLSLSTGSFTNGTDANGKPITQTGLGGDVAILANNLLVVESASAQPATAGVVQLDVAQLDNLEAQTLILGASASSGTAGEQLSLGSVQTGFTQTVELANTTALTAPQIILAAQNSVTVDAGAKISASSPSGASTPLGGPLLLTGGGALLRVSSGSAATVSVDPTTLPATPTGTVAIQSGANVQASGSLLIYGTNATTVASDATISAPAVNLYSSTVSLGAAPAGTDGLVLSPQLLGALQGLTDLTLGSSSTINLFGTVALGTAGSNMPGLSSITLDATGINGYGAGDKTFQAANISLTNSTGLTAAASTADGTGALSLIAAASSASKSGQITLGAGAKNVSGFGAVNLQADGEIQFQGTGSLTVASNGAVPLNMSAVALIGTAAASQSFTTSGAITVSQSAANSTLALPAAGLGAKLALTGMLIDQSGTLNTPAGSVTLTATDGSVTLGQGSVTAAAGADKNYTVTDAVSAGGAVSLLATHGNVVIDPGAIVDVAGVSSASVTVAGDAGSLTVSAPQGTFTFFGSTLEGSAAAGRQPGSFSLDVGSGLAGGGLSALTAALADGGFDGPLSLRTRTEPAVILAGSVQATSFKLAADHGSIDVAGTAVINTSGSSTLGGDGGAISLWAGTGLTLESGAQLLANAGAAGPQGANGSTLASHAGNITLGTTSGMLALDAGSTVSLHGGGDATTDGTLTLRTPRTADGTNVQATVQSGVNITSRDAVVVEGFKTYTATDVGVNADEGCGSGGSCDTAVMGGVLYSDAASFVAAMATLPANLAGLGNVQVRPGIEIDSPVTATSRGDLVLDNSADAWDLAAWNAALGTPVNLTLRAAGNLVFEASLSDGFTSTGGAVAGWTFGEPAGSGAGSASYRLTGGADLSAADPLAVVPQTAAASSLSAAVPNAGNEILTPGNLIRSGSGNIEVAAGGDVLLGYNDNGYDANGALQVSESDPLTSVIYTAGVPFVLTDAQSSLFTPTNTGRRSQVGSASYPTDGGDVSVTAAIDVRSAVSSQSITDWLWRRSGGTGTFTPASNTSWWILFSQFQQGIGALGGGNVTLTAGRDIVNTSAVIPTTGRLIYNSNSGTAAALSDLVLTGGGSLRVKAGGDVVSGVFEDDWGNASITAGGSVTSSSDSTFGQAYPTAVGGSYPAQSTEIYPLLVVGNGTFTVNAANGIAIEGVSNSTTLPITTANQSAVSNVLGDKSFFTYAPSSNSSTLTLMSAGGDVTLQDGFDSVGIVSLNGVSSTYETSTSPSLFLATYPSTVNLESLSGNVNFGNTASANVTGGQGISITLYPSASGNLEVLAAQSINNDTPLNSITLSEADTASVPNAVAAQGVANYTGLAGLSLPLTPLHENDSTSIDFVAQTGNIASVLLNFPKQADVIAGGTITDLNYTGKNINPSDVTLIEAGGDIDYSTPTAAVTNALLVNSYGITVGGPGHVEVLAGGTINLGDGTGVVTSGNLGDSRLASTGAALTVGAGFGENVDGSLRQPATQSFIDAYLVPDKSGNASSYSSDLIAYMQALYPTTDANISYASAVTAFESLTFAQQLPLLGSVLSNELSQTGLLHTSQGTSYTRGYAAIDTLFPTGDAQGNALKYSGDLNLYYSQVKTEQGGNIDLMVPGGSVVVGVPNPAPGLTAVKGFSTATGVQVPGTVDLGVLVLAQGAIQGFAAQNFEVNQSRMLTLEGGDIILWASNGNIDAGKGAKSASGAAPPTIETDSNGNSFVDASNSVTGSGIGQLLTGAGETAGLVNLIAPKGAVDAGDAGIRVAGNLNIAAVQVIGAGNISVVGTSSGVPVSSAGALAGALSGANSLGDSSKNAVSQLAQDLGTSANYQQLTNDLAPTFISVKMFCLGVDCETP